MLKRLTADAGYVDAIDRFLSSGSIDTVENIFASIGIDAYKTETFTQSLESLEDDINEFGRIVHK